MSDRRRLGGHLSTPPVAYSAVTRADLFPSIAGRAPLERGNVLQSLLDVLALLGAFLLVSATGIGIAFSVFVLLFVRL